ncbi:MAG: NACHT domain-containing protein [Paludibacter sp.]|nr:NACHT domain-containing protein [Paludibacter sp.]
MEGSYSQAGFYYQNNIAALKIIECLFFNSDIREIRLENYDKGHHIDDIIIYREDKIDYYQVKWSEDEDKTYSLFGLLNSEVNTDGKTIKKSLFKLLAEGYLSAKKNSGNFSISLYTTKKGSNQKRPSQGVNHGLLEIITQFFDLLKQSDLRYDFLPNYKDYKDTIEKIRQECSLDEDSFNEFIKNLEFKFNQEPTDQIQNALKFKLEALGIETNLFEKLLNTSVKWSISGESITKDLVLQEIGISDRFEDKLSHYFKVVDEEYYVPNQLFFEQLEKGLTELEGGYIFIEGLPGIGKSTALTKFKENNPTISLAYYCFIPDTKNDFGEFRHKSYYFLKSLCITIEKNFPEVDFPSRYSERYEEKLKSYIEKLSTLKKKIIFIIDGLDHVHRDTNLGEMSLLNYIKGNLPENIYFILSSQYDAVLSPSVKLQIDSDSRRHIKVSPFIQSEIKQYLENKGVYISDNLDSIERLSGGIPIYLHYISEILAKIEQKDYEKTLEDLPILVDGKISSYHEYLFQKIENDTFAKWVLAVLAYRKENTSNETIQQILKLAGEERNITEIETIINKYSHLLRQIDGRSYSIFHNSFREFIILKTVGLKDIFNKALVSFYEQNPFADEAYRNYFSHLYEIGEYNKIISTTKLEWLKSAWRSFRSLEEIKENLEIAIKATIEKTSLSDFIRIAFLKDQFERLKWNLSGTDINFSLLLLNVGENANSLRTIWDGDFVLTNKEYFCFYLGKYYQKTGNLLPQNVINQGLSKSLKNRNSENITLEMKAEALLFDNIINLFEEIDSIKWEDSNEHRKSYLRNSHSNQQNDKINLKIKIDIIDFLADCKQYNKLFQLAKTFKEDQKLLPKIQIALIKLLLPTPTEKKSAIKIITEIDFENVSDKTYFKHISFCSNFLDNEEIKALFPKRTITEPQLFEKVVDKEGMTYALRKEIINLYDNLKSIWFFQPELVSTLILKNSFLSSPAEDIYESIFNLSDLWYKSRNNNLEEEEITTQLKSSIESLYIKREKEFRTRARGLFDMDTDSSFITDSIKHLFKNIFNLSTQLLSRDKLEELIDYWIKLDVSGDGFRHYSVGLTIANELYNSKHNNLSELIHKIINHAEETARLEQDTVTLTSNLAEISEIYGKCRFKEDFQRIYNQLIEISFGVGHRKDYQASNIVEPLEFIHQIDPDNTLKRLSEVFHIQDILGRAGNGRMRHICLSDLISFTSEKYPQLAFQLMQTEESNISRDETISRVITPLIEICSNEDLELYLAIIKTLSRWKNAGSSEGHFLYLAQKLLLRAIHFKNIKIIGEILDIVKFNTLIELEDKKELSKFSKILTENGINYTLYSIPNPEIITDNNIISTVLNEQSVQKDKFIIRHDKLQFEELIQLFEDNFEEFEKYIQKQFTFQSQNERNQSLRKEYKSAKKIFESFYDEASAENKLILDANKYKIIRKYLNLKNKIVNFNSDIPINLSEIKKFFGAFIEKVNNLFSNKILSTYVNEKVDMEQWLESILHNINWRSDNLFYRILSDKEVLSLVDQCSIMSIENLLKFIVKWAKDKTRSSSLLKIANRLISIDPQKAKDIVLLASQFEFDSSLFQRNDDPDKLDFDIIETILKIDKEFGKKFLLKSYFTQKGKYNGDLTNSLDKLLKYKEYFDDGAVEMYYEANLQYNCELALGLTTKDNKYEFIAKHSEIYNFPEIVIQHLVWLFNYPAIKIRELALQSAFDLIEKNTTHIQSFINFGIKKGNDNEVEYSIIVLQAIALKNPSLLIQFKNELMNLLKKEHFNILETSKELLQLINQFDSSFLTADEIRRLRTLNTASPIIFENILLKPISKKTKFLYSFFQCELFEEVYENDDDDISIYDIVFNDILIKGWGDYDVEKEGAVHQEYNINSNFDTIEIQSPYYDEVKSSLNKIFHSQIKRNKFKIAFVEKIKTKFRIYDPSKLLYSIITRPDFINWIPENITKKDFLSFNDFDTLTKDFFLREEDYITLAEYGNQRKNKYKELNGTCYFEIRAFLKKRNFELSELDPLPFIQLENQYAYEVPKVEYKPSSFPIKQIIPLIQISYNNYRGEPDLGDAIIFSDTFSKLGIEEKKLLNILQNQDNYSLKAFKWINSYAKGSDWRRYKPLSEGYTLKIRKNILLQYLKANDLTLCYNIKLKRSADEHIPESHMKWNDLERNIEIDL